MAKPVSLKKLASREKSLKDYLKFLQSAKSAQNPKTKSK